LKTGNSSCKQLNIQETNS